MIKESDDVKPQDAAMVKFGSFFGSSKPKPKAEAPAPKDPKAKPKAEAPKDPKAKANGSGLSWRGKLRNAGRKLVSVQKFQAAGSCARVGEATAVL